MSKSVQKEMLELKQERLKNLQNNYNEQEARGTNRHVLDKLKQEIDRTENDILLQIKAIQDS